MPELPEVETVRRGLARVMEGRRIARVEVRRTDLRLPVPDDFADRLVGRTLERLRRRAKYLIGEFDDGTVLLVHLGMSGRMLIETSENHQKIGEFVGKSDAHQTHEHIVFHVGNGTVIRFSDPRRFGLMVLTDQTKVAHHKLLFHLGPEPTDSAFTGGFLSQKLKGKKTPIKSALLDQRIVAGLGNIYACEALFDAGISPRRAAANIQGERANRLTQAIREVLERAILAGGSTLQDHVMPSGELGYFQHQFSVYGRDGEKCPGCNCNKTIRRIVQSGRSTFYCSSRQR
ncbi:MAG: bifunctional DNA-formamidopyrimidine glycosylase/DNA-(apurinic or apyrimidinic site) lyase [Pseudomonadota bacterium]|nr:bifunctional DNA-formamidopyrimidine glycosylase/DNA-(apurinic or apyrimidinic site) lyase [Pseudomonadota bacterium]